MYDAQMREYFKFLDDLRENGVTNMFGAVPYLKDVFGLNYVEAREVLLSWMKSREGK